MNVDRPISSPHLAFLNRTMLLQVQAALPPISGHRAHVSPIRRPYYLTVSAFFIPAW